MAASSPDSSAAEPDSGALEKMEPRELDYILAVNCATSFMLLKVGKLKEAHDFIISCEKIVTLLIGYNVEGKLPLKLKRYKQ